MFGKVEEELRRQVAELREDLRFERDRYEKLVAEMAGMVRDGYRVASVAPSVTLPQIPDAITLTVQELAGDATSPTGRHLMRYAITQWQNNVPIPDIVDALRRGA